MLTFNLPFEKELFFSLTETVWSLISEKNGRCPKWSGFVLVWKLVSSKMMPKTVIGQ